MLGTSNLEIISSAFLTVTYPLSTIVFFTSEKNSSFLLQISANTSSTSALFFYFMTSLVYKSAQIKLMFARYRQMSPSEMPCPGLVQSIIFSISVSKLRPKESYGTHCFTIIVSLQNFLFCKCCEYSDCKGITFNQYLNSSTVPA